MVRQQASRAATVGRKANKATALRLPVHGFMHRLAMVGLDCEVRRKLTVMRHL